MNKEAEFLKYLDKELSSDEAEKFEKFLNENPDQKKLLENMAKKRQQTLDALEMLNPEGAINIPAFEGAIQNSGTASRNPFLLITHFRRYAAAILILVCIAIAFVLFNRQEVNQQKIVASEMISENQKTDEFEELNEYISPNRNWNKRELVWTVLKLE